VQPSRPSRKPRGQRQGINRRKCCFLGPPKIPVAFPLLSSEDRQRPTRPATCPRHSPEKKGRPRSTGTFPGHSLINKKRLRIRSSVFCEREGQARTYASTNSDRAEKCKGRHPFSSPPAPFRVRFFSAGAFRAKRKRAERGVFFVLHDKLKQKTPGRPAFPAGR